MKKEKDLKQTIADSSLRAQRSVANYVMDKYEQFEESLHLTPKKLLNFIYICICIVLVSALITLYSVIRIWL